MVRNRLILGSGLDKSADLLPTVFIRHLRVRSERERKRTTAAPKERERKKEVEKKEEKGETKWGKRLEKEDGEHSIQQEVDQSTRQEKTSCMGNRTGKER